MVVLFVREWFGGLSQPSQSLLIATLVLLIGLVVGAIAAWIVQRMLLAFDVDSSVEGTAFERTAGQLGTSTVELLGRLSGLFVFFVAAAYAAETLQVLPSEVFLEEIARFLPQLFIAILVVIVGLLVGDKAELVVSERLRSIKLPETAILPTLVKFSIVFVAILVALSQLGVATAALLVLFAAYAFGVVFLFGLAFKDLMASAAAGIYVLLTAPYGIGDEITIAERRGVVQEVTVFVTTIERDGTVNVIPNRTVLQNGVTVYRDR
ncbi:MAG: mechanosensitive ion channel family protein, partial [Natronomonas sp.]